MIMTYCNIRFCYNCSQNFVTFSDNGIYWLVFVLPISLYLIGSLSSNTCTLRMCHIYDMETEKWSRGPNMKEERSYHGLVRISDTLYAVGGCGQLNSIESLCLSSIAIDNLNNK